MTFFQVWAPEAKRVRVQVVGADAHEMDAAPDGWWQLDVPSAGPGTDYGFLLDDGDQLLPDPRTRWQPDGVHGPSRVYDPEAFSWSDTAWTGRPLPGAVIYEMHIGTFTPGGTFDSAIERLDHLVDLGVTHLELLPVNAVNGVWNWGYDGVDWYAVHAPLGGPDGLKRFVDAAHARGLAVLQDVVYNHLGPSGNYLPLYGPYLKSGKNTWGDLVNLDGEGSEVVRRFILDNALMWLSEFHMDGLRLDAVHALQDESVPHILEQLSREVDALEAHLERPLTLIAESDLNDPAMVTPREAGGRGMTGQWDDDVHHALHVLLTGEHQGYYDDFGGLGVVAKVMTHAFMHDGTFSTFRGRKHGRPVNPALIPGYRFVVCIQDHDQVGNRAVGDRITELTSPDMLKLGATLLLSTPFTPMLWMGEEWAASTRWPFFTSHPEKELAEATAKGRIEEFGQHGWDTSQMIDPQDPAAYHEAILDWDEPGTGVHAEVLDVYRRMIALRKAEPDLSDPRLDRVEVEYDDDAEWLVLHRGSLRVLVNVSSGSRPVPVVASEIVFSTGTATIGEAAVTLAPQTAAVVRI